MIFTQNKMNQHFVRARHGNNTPDSPDEMKKHTHLFTVIFTTPKQRRTNLDVDFNRTWDEYVTGFGDLSGDYWLGLRKLRTLSPMLTTGSPHCQIQVETIDGNTSTVEFRCGFYTA